MRLFSLDQKEPLNFLVCGNLISEDGFLHMKRNFDDNVLIFVQKGTLFINSNSKSYKIGENQFIFLKAGEEHFGYKKSEGPLSYYWLHFKTSQSFQNPESIPQNEQQYLFSESGTLIQPVKINLLFRQLMDYSLEENFYNKSILDYLCSAILMELSNQFQFMEQQDSQKKNPLVFEMISWIKQNFNRQFTIQELSETVGYQSDYMAKIFKENTNQTILQYTNHIRVESAKKLLPNFSVKETAYSCGFEDDKYFMKVFKKEEGITPGEYKNAFFKKNVNNK